MRLAIRHLALILLLALPAFAQEAAKLVPAGAAVYIEVNDLASLRKDWVSDPLAKFIRENVPMPPQDGWEQVQKVMGMSGDQVIDRFLGTAAALVIFDPNDDEPAMVISKVADADAALAIEKLQLKPTGEFAGYRGFKSPDDKAHIAIGKGWVVVSQPRYADAARAVLEGKEKPLAEDPLFKSWIGKLPGERAATVFVKQGDEQHVHALGVYRKGRDLTLQYRGKSPEVVRLLSMLGNARSLDFGPLPASTIAAVSANLMPLNGLDSKQLDRLFAGKNFNRDILPKLGAPAVLFLGEVPGEMLEPNPGLALPVLGVSLKLKDPKAADDLTKAIDGLLFIASFATAKWEGPAIETKDLTHGDTPYRVANVGAAIAHRAGRDELKPINLAYGRIGEWYVVCTQDQFFRQCIDANLDSTRSLIASRSFTAMPLKNHEGPIATAVLRPAELSVHIGTWLMHWKKVRPQVMADAASAEPTTPEARFVRGARIISGLLDHYQSMSLQAYRDGDGVAAQADVVRK